MEKINIGVIGTGTAGITTIAHLLAWLPQDWCVTSIHDPNQPILGIGESTTTSIPESLYTGADLNILKDAELLDATIKFGVKYVNWRKEEIYNIIPPPFYGIHFNNFALKDVCFDRFRKKWENKFHEVQGNLSLVTQDDIKVTCTIDKILYEFDYVIDCRGYPDVYEDYRTVETIPVNHCLVHTIHRPGNWDYTYHQATQNGWMFGIPLQKRQGWGYLFNDTITSVDDAVDDLKQIFYTDIEKTELREFKFKNYCAHKIINGRICKNGNRALFYEPLEALSGWFYDRVVRTFYDVIVTKNYTERQANEGLQTLAEDYELFICYMYHKGSTFESPFWDATVKKCSYRLENSQRFDFIKKFLQPITPEFYGNVPKVLPFPYGIIKKIDKNFGFNYFQ